MKDWTFKDFADDFDTHVREQLPWYDLVTESIQFIVKSYLPYKGHVYDIGCSTGNITESLLDLLVARQASLCGIDNEQSMMEAYSRFLTHQNVTAHHGDATNYNYANFDVAIVFLTAMFIPAQVQQHFFTKLYSKLNQGGAIIVVDKTTDTQGYFSTVMKRLTWHWKLENGVLPNDIMEKELSLAGVQRPITPELMSMYDGKQFFQMGEFKGWVIEK
jgi:tRNA (cmo5U34)-methyltransferase